MNMTRVSMTMLVTILAGWLGWSFWEAYQPKAIILQGQIEAEEYSMSSKVPGRIGDVLVKRGDPVTAGQLLFTIDSPEIDAKLAQAKGAQQTANALARAAESGARKQEIEIARDEWETAKAAENLAQKSYERMNNLFEEGVVAEQRRDELLAMFQAAQYQTRAAYQLYSMALEGAREETQDATAGQANAASGLVAEVEASAIDTEIRSRYAGEVANVFLNPGELAPLGFPVLTVQNPAESWAVFQVREDLLKHTTKGQQLSLRIPALSEAHYSFVVTHISVMGSFATWRSTSATEGYDLKTFEVEARPLDPIVGLRPGMTTLLAL